MNTQSNSDVSRRKISKTAIWSAPVLAATAAAPAASASGEYTMLVGLINSNDTLVVRSADFTTLKSGNLTKGSSYKFRFSIYKNGNYYLQSATFTIPNYADFGLSSATTTIINGNTTVTVKIPNTTSATKVNLTGSVQIAAGGSATTTNIGTATFV